MTNQDSTSRLDYFVLAKQMVLLEYAVKVGQDSWLRRLADVYAAQAEKAQRTDGVR